MERMGSPMIGSTTQRSERQSSVASHGPPTSCSPHTPEDIPAAPAHTALVQSSGSPHVSPSAALAWHFLVHHFEVLHRPDLHASWSLHLWSISLRPQRPLCPFSIQSPRQQSLSWLQSFPCGSLPSQLPSESGEAVGGMLD